MKQGQTAWYIKSLVELPVGSKIVTIYPTPSAKPVLLANGVKIPLHDLYETHADCEKAITTKVAAQHGFAIDDDVYLVSISSERIHHGKIENFYMGTHGDTTGVTYATIPVYTDDGEYDYTAYYDLKSLYKTHADAKASIDARHEPTRDTYRDKIASPETLIQFMWEQLFPFECSRKIHYGEPISKSEQILAHNPYVDDDALVVIKEKAKEFGIPLNINIPTA